MSFLGVIESIAGAIASVFTGPYSGAALGGARAARHIDLNPGTVTHTTSRHEPVSYERISEMVGNHYGMTPLQQLRLQAMIQEREFELLRISSWGERVHVLNEWAAGIKRGAPVVVKGSFQILQKAECPVCKTPVVVKEAQSCPRCEVPYHEECWNGRCAIFACEP